MKIVYIYTALTTFGGVDRIITNKANYFADKLGYEVYIITDSQVGKETIFPLSNKIKHIDLDINFDKQYHLNLFRRTICYFSLIKKYRKKLENILLEIKPQFVISTCGRELDFLTNLNDESIKIGESHIAKAFCRNFHLMEKRGFPYKQVAKYWRKKQERAIKKLDAFVVLTQQDAESWNGINKNIQIIPNPIFYIPREKSSLNNKRVIAVGRLDVQKGFDMLIDAWSIVIEQHNDWYLDIYGDGILQKELEEQIKTLKLTNYCSLHHASDNIYAKYMESSICVMSSRYEGFGLILIEAMSCGIPCISYNCPYGPSDIIKNNEDGILVEPNNIYKLYDAISYLINNKDKRLEFGKKAKENVERYSVNNIMGKWVSLFNTLQ